MNNCKSNGILMEILLENITGEEQSGIMMGNNNEESIDVVKLLVLFRMEMRRDKLLSSLSTYDNNAKLDHHAINRHRTELYHRQIYLTERVNHWVEEEFHPQTFSTQFISHPALNDHPAFREIKHTFDEYNREARGEEHKTNQQHIKSKKMVELMKLMINLIGIDDKQIQLRMLEKTHKWMKDNLKHTPDKYESTKDKRVKSPSQAKIAVELPKIPTNLLKAESMDYQDKTRTLHKYMYTPKDRIRNYKRRILSFEESLKKVHSKNNLDQKNPKIVYMRTEPETVYEMDDADHEAVEENLDMPPIDQPLEEFAGGLAEDEDVEADLVEEDSKEGKLNPQVKNYIFPDIPNYQKSEITLKKHLQLRISKQQRENRQDKEEEDAILRFRGRKARFETETSRKLQSVNDPNRLGTLNTQVNKLRSLTETSANPKIKDFSSYRAKEALPQTSFEEYSSLQHVKEVKKSSSQSLSIIDKDIPIRREGLSIFGKERPTHNKKWLSVILREQHSQSQTEQDLSELQKIKYRLAQNKVPFEMKKIYNGLLKPNDLSMEEMSTIGHPEGSMLSNPDFKVGKKKKRKKGRK